jgi:hypothetical protein
MRGAYFLKGKAVDVSTAGPTGSLEKRGDELAQRIPLGAKPLDFFGRIIRDAHVLMLVSRKSA